MKWTILEPLDPCTCEHCQHSVLDLGRGIVCREHDIIIKPEDYHKVVSCVEWKSPWQNDYRRRYDLEKELTK